MYMASVASDNDPGKRTALGELSDWVRLPLLTLMIIVG